MPNKCNLGKRGLLDLVEGQYCNIKHRSHDPGQLYALKTSDKRWKYNNNNVKKLKARMCYTFYYFFSMEQLYYLDDDRQNVKNLKIKDLCSSSGSER